MHLLSKLVICIYCSGSISMGERLLEIEVEMKDRGFKLVLQYIPIIAVALILFKLISQYDIVINFFHKALKVFTPLIWGGVIAYLLNPLMKFVKKK